MDVFIASDYRGYLQKLVGERGAGRARGAIKKLAQSLKCHPTYVSQVVKGRAHLSVDQALALCVAGGLDRAETAFLLDLYHRDRAGTELARSYYDARLSERLAERTNLRARLQISETLSSDQEARYFDSWIPQAVHLLCQLPGLHTVKSLAATLHLDQAKIELTLRELRRVGFVEAVADGFVSTRDSVFLGRDSPMIQKLHVNWRLKTVGDLQGRATLPGTHYSTVASLSWVAAERVRELILEHIEATRAEILPSAAETLYVYCLDYYPLTERQG